jgi:hypothetical protein
MSKKKDLVYSESDMQRAIEDAYMKGKSDAAMALKKSQQDQGLYTWSDLEKAINESYALGYKHGYNKKPVPVSMPDLGHKIKIEALSKSVSDNGRKISNEILNKQRSIVKAHMEAWAKDVDKALDEILSAAEHHKKHEY